MDAKVFDNLIDEVITKAIEAADKIIEEFIEPIGNIGNPEELIGKRYEYWTQEDLQKLMGIYGQSPDSPLSRLIFNREYDILKEKEAETYGNSTGSLPV